MTENEARQHALGYAVGREDGSQGVRTFDPTGKGMGFMQFAEAYAQHWADFNKGFNWYVTNAATAYEAWQESKGATTHRKRP